MWGGPLKNETYPFGGNISFGKGPLDGLLVVPERTWALEVLVTAKSLTFSGLTENQFVDKKLKS